MYAQRSGPQPNVVQGLWLPRAEPEGVELRPQDGDLYAVVDDLEGDRAVVVLDQWPQVDGSGHLVFPGDAETRDFAIADLQRLVNRRRSQAGQQAPDRALRVGDVFWIRGASDADLATAQNWQILDITGPARRAARAAQLVAANPALRASASEPTPGPGELSADTPAQRPATGAAPPAV
jgi:hypothetical protein